MKLKKVKKELLQILENINKSKSIINKKTAQVHPDYLLSAKNLCHYLLLRSYELRKYHDALSEVGVSSLRTGEGYVYNNLFHVVQNLHLILGLPLNLPAKQEPLGYRKSKKLLRKHANSLFNETNKRHFTEIMVTLPLEAAQDRTIIEGMVTNGMEIARINLSHGNLDDWKKMVHIIRDIREQTGQKIKIYMDLSGPKLRTAPIEIQTKKGNIKSFIRIKKGEHIILTKRRTKGKRSRYGINNELIEKAEIGVLLPQVIDDANIGDTILFDDGMIRSKVIAKRNDELEIIITNTYKTKLAGNKGINLPETQLHLPALTQPDIAALPFVCNHADIVGYSFVRTGDDVLKLYEVLEQHEADHLGVVFKIENKDAFENLPEILLEGMRRNKIGVMIARGDLAVEIGFERISEVQNQILWFCEAAHVPVIWATQVLENLAKTGIPTRAEVSDAAQAAQAECVMLNKGLFINEAITVLKDILIRMEGHSFKKKSQLRALNIAKKFIQKSQV